MRKSAIRLAVVGALGIPLLAPMPAGAATKDVSMGLPESAQRSFERLGLDVNDFFPNDLTIHVGDSLRFIPSGFHTADLPGRGDSALPVFVPTGQQVSGVNDEGGRPFWFNGQDQLGVNPALVQEPLFGRRATFNGRSRVDTGLPLERRPRPAVVRFTRRGTFTFLCDVHPGMKGRVHVVSRRAEAPSKRSDERRVRRMLRRDLRIGKALRRKRAPAGTVDVGEAGPFGVEYFAFLPRNITVPVGTTLNFRITSRSREAHTATTGPGDPLREPDSYLGTLSGSFGGPAPDPRAIYPSEPPGSSGQLTRAFHGNGFWNSGALDRDAASPSPSLNSVTFSEPGTYQFYCLIHPFMHGTVAVPG